MVYPMHLFALKGLMVVITALCVMEMEKITGIYEAPQVNKHNAGTTRSLSPSYYLTVTLWHQRLILKLFDLAQNQTP